MFLYETGGRIKETLGLKWEYLDLNGMTITFSNKVNRHKKDVIPISNKLIPILDELKVISASRPSSEANAKLFRWGENSSSRLTKRLSDIERVLGIKLDKQAFHRLRNTFSDRLSQANIPILLYSDLMRYKDYRTTLNHYRVQHIEKLREVIDSI
jgi:integrase